MKLKWSLPTKALVLMALPLLFQVGLFAYLATLQNRSAGLVSDLMHPLEVNSVLAATLDDFLRLWTVYGSPSELLSPEFDECRRDGFAGISKLKAIFSGDPKLTKIFDRALVAGDKTVDVIDENMNLIVSHEPALAEKRAEVLLSIDDMFEPVGDMTRMIPSLVDKETSQSDSSVQRWLNIDRRYRNVLEYGLLVEILLIALAWYLFGKDVRQRLKVTIDNALLASHGQIETPVGGTDEISQIDSAFQAMSSRLVESEKKRNMLAENTRAVLCVLNEKLSFAEVNGATAALLGYQPQELLQMKVAQLLLIEHSSNAATLFESIKSGGTTGFESKCVRKDGTLVETEWSARWSSEARMFFCTVHDNTERKRAERIRSELMRIVSESLKKPLANMNSLFQSLDSGNCGHLTERGTSLLQRARSSNSQMLRLVNDLLEIEQVQSGTLEIQLSHEKFLPIAERALHAVSGLAGYYGVQVRVVQCDLEIRTDKDRLLQILVNLLTNAIKFSPRGAEVVLDAIQIGDRTEVRVIDSGRGIPADHLASIFDRFSQTQISDNREKGGSGLGLAICKALAELHGGTITVASVEGKGTTFTVLLPRGDKGVVSA